MMRDMEERFGIILLQNTACILRVYAIHGRHWRLFYYLSTDFATTQENQSYQDSVSIRLAELFSSEYLHHIAEWKICARKVLPEISKAITDIMGISVENLTPAREEELLCKGMFTELW